MSFEPMAPVRAAVASIVLGLGLVGCAATDTTTTTDTGSMIRGEAATSANTSIDGIPDYLIGPYDRLEIFVWRAEELTSEVVVRPDGRISTPLVQDMLAAGKTPTELRIDLEEALSEYVKSPQVNVIVKEFSSTVDQQIRVLGEAQRPLALPYQANMTILDVMLGVGGLTEFAAGNRAKLIRGRGADQMTYRIRLNDLMRRGDVSANVPVQPGDVILIPETRF